MIRSLPLMLVPIALLSACGGGESADGDSRATGQVAEGTISDAMLPLDTVRSQPPLAAPESTASGTAGKGTATKDGSEDSADASATTAASDDGVAPANDAAPVDPIGAAISAE